MREEAGEMPETVVTPWFFQKSYCGDWFAELPPEALENASISRYYTGIRVCGYGLLHYFELPHNALRIRFILRRKPPRGEARYRNVLVGQNFAKIDGDRYEMLYGSAAEFLRMHPQYHYVQLEYRVDFGSEQGNAD